MNEHGFVKAVHKHLSSDVYRWKINDRFTGGVPDAFYAGPASILFVEYKFIYQLPKKTIKTGLSALQQQWLNRMSEYGLPCWVVIGTEKEGTAVLKDTSAELDVLPKDAFDPALTYKDVAMSILEATYG